MITVVDYWAEWCGPCKIVAPTLEKLANEGLFNLRKINIDELPSEALAAEVRSIPTLVFLDSQGRELDRHVGTLSEKALRVVIDELSA